MRRLNRIGSLIGLTCSLWFGAAQADVVVVVSAKSPITTLSKQQVTDIFLGKSVRFPDGSLAVPVDQTEGTAPRNDFYLQFTGKSAAQLRAHWSKIIFTGRGQPPKVISTSAELIKLLGRNPNAIGYIDEYMVDGTVKIVHSR
jgi:ABC-type phosphate transport system substrate-binding protein